MDSSNSEPSQDLTQPPPAPPSTERYLVEEQIAAGGQGIVFRGRDRHTGQQVIVKQLPAEYLADPARVARFVREGKALSQLNHPNIVRILATHEQEGQHAIVMEYMPGGTLRELLDRKGPLPLEQLLNIALELADALVRAHHLEILHRDIKPENVLLTEDGAPCLTDFGAALLKNDEALAARLTRTGTTIGSPAYMSPEALYGEELDVRGDIWSFGVLLYEMIAGRRPFDGDTTTHIIVQILHDPAPSLSTLRPQTPKGLVALVDAILVKQRANRLGSMRLVASALEAIRDGLPLEELAFLLPSAAQAQPAAPSLPAASAPVPGAPTPSQTPPSIAQHLPARATPFLGRDRELRELATLLGDPDLRLLTIIGPGGIGKTRLALQAARTIQPVFPDGVYFVPLAPISAAEEIVFAIAQSIDLHFYRPSEARQQLFEYLQRKELLLVLDNFEHLLEGATLLADIVESAPGVTLLVTSRASLNLSFQHLYTLHGLSFPDEGAGGKTAEEIKSFPAVQLLLQQARLVRANFELGAAEIEAAARVARLVQGMPLGVVLAARWAELLSMDEIAEEISISIDFLDTTMQDLPPRQRSVRAVFETSWQHLTPAVQEAFARLSVFRGGFTREAAREVSGADLHALLELVRKSFVTIAQRGRYEVHELLRQYGEEQLLASGQAEDICDAHSAYYLGLMGRREEDLKGRRQTGALREIEVDFQNVRHAWTWALRQQDRQAIDRALEALHLFCDIRARHQEGIELFSRARQRMSPAPGQEPDPLWGRIVTRHGFLQVLVPADPDKVAAELEQGLTIAEQHGDKYEIAIAQLALGLFAAVVVQDPGHAQELNQRAREQFEELGETFFETRALVGLGITSATGSEPVAFAGYLQEAVKKARASGDKVDVALCLANLTEFAVGMGQYSTAEEYCTEALDLAREIGVPTVTAFCQTWLACIDLLHGNLEAAANTLHESHSIAEDINSQTVMAYTSGLAALAAGLLGDYEEGRYLAEDGRSNPANNTLGLVLAPWALTIAHIGLQDRPAAAEALRDALEQAQALAFPAPPLWLLPVAAFLIAEEEAQQARAVELVALASTHPLSPHGWMNTWAPLRKLRQRLRDGLDADVYQAAWERGKDLDVSAVVMQLIEHFSSSLIG